MNFGGKRRKTHYYLRVSSELTFSLRNLRRSPGFALTAICTFALAIGTSTAVFSVVNRVLLEPPPISDPDRVMVMWARERGAGTIGEISHSTFRAWQEKTRSFESLAAMGSVNWSLVLRENGDSITHAAPSCGAGRAAARIRGHQHFEPLRDDSSHG